MARVPKKSRPKSITQAVDAKESYRRAKRTTKTVVLSFYGIDSPIKKNMQTTSQKHGLSLTPLNLTLELRNVQNYFFTMYLFYKSYKIHKDKFLVVHFRNTRNIE